MAAASTELAVPAPADVDKAVEVMKSFQQAKIKLLDKNDVQLIKGKQYIKRSGWRKIALAFHISIEIVDVSREKTDDRYIVRVKARATWAAGKFAEEVGVCDSSELEKGNIEPTLHNIETKAATRAINRAISDVVGGGEISADELSKDLESEVLTPNGDNPAAAQLSRHGDNPHGSEGPQEPNFSKRMTWKVKNSEFPIPPEAAPYKSLLRTKIIPGLTSKDHVTIEEELVGGHVAALKIGSPDLTIQTKVLKDLTSAIEWALKAINKCEFRDVKVTVE